MLKGSITLGVTDSVVVVAFQDKALGLAITERKAAVVFSFRALAFSLFRPL